MTAHTKEWTPPFCANEIEELECPACGAGAVRVREHDTYYEGHEIEAYCADCHAELAVTANVSVTFSNVEEAI